MRKLLIYILNSLHSDWNTPRINQIGIFILDIINFRIEESENTFTCFQSFVYSFFLWVKDHLRSANREDRNLTRMKQRVQGYFIAHMKSLDALNVL